MPGPRRTNGSDLRTAIDAASRALAEHVLGADSVVSKAAMLEQAFEANPADAGGEISALLGRLYFQQQQYGQSARHLEAASAKRPADAEVAALLERARRNCETRIEHPLTPVVFTDAARW